MGQREIYQVIEELGGTAHPKEIKQLLEKKFPNASMHDYVYFTLKLMKKWDIVEKNQNGSWSIIDKFE